MSLLVPAVMFGWIPAVIALFAMLPPRRAVIAAFLIAWLFLPMAGYSLQGLPDYTKMSATCFGVFLGAALFDSSRLTTFKLRWIDLPMIVWCLCPFASSMSNDLGLYDGVTAVFHRTVAWGLPYFIGRLYFSDLDGLRELAIGVFIGGLIYVPLCLYEIRMSPQLHTIIYGYHQHSFAQTLRFGGWRPTVFMQHGLMVGMWMISASLAGVWLWMSGTMKKMGNIPLPYFLIPLLVTTVLVKSFGALVLLVVGLAALFATKYVNSRTALCCLILVPPVYMVMRTSGYGRDQLVDMAERVGGEERAGSLDARLRQEDVLSDKALEQPLFGWGGWGRNMVYDESGNKALRGNDGFWIIVLGTNGLVGLSAVYAAFLLPVGVLIWRTRPEVWSSPAGGALVALSVILLLHMIDCIPNGMINPIFTLICGGVSSAAAAVWAQAPEQRTSRLHATVSRKYPAVQQ